MSATPLLPGAPSDMVLGFALPRIDAAAALDAIVAAARAGEGGYVCVPNVSALVAAHKDAEYAAALRDARLVLPDSTILQKARAFLHGGATPETVYGSVITERLCALAAMHGLSVGFHGGSPETLSKLVARMRAQCGALSVAHAQSPPYAPFSAESARREAADIAAKAPSLLFIGLGAPKQEKWMRAASPLLPNTLVVGVGAAFDALAGTVPAPPAWLHRAGLGWLFRLAVEPRRLWRRYAETLAPFVAMVAAEKIALMRTRTGA